MDWRVFVIPRCGTQRISSKGFVVIFVKEFSFCLISDPRRLCPYLGPVNFLVILTAGTHPDATLRIMRIFGRIFVLLLCCVPRFGR